MQKVFEIFEQLENTPGTNDALVILKAHKDNEEFKNLLKLALDPYVKFHISTMPKGVLPAAQSTVSLSEFKLLTEDLTDRLLTGNAARNAVASFLSKADEGDFKWYTRILQKNPRIGVDAKSINKVIPGLIRSFDIQRAEAYSPKKPKTRAKITFPIYSSPKMDGMRCVYRKGELWSRGGHLIETVPHIQRLLSELFGDEYVFDGELWFPSDTGFEDFISIVKRQNPHINSTSVLFNIFDVMRTEEWDAQKCEKTFEERYTLLRSLISKDNSSLVVVEHTLVNSFEEVLELYEKYLEDGFEGSMLKSPKGKYVFKKSWDWIKVKPEEDEEFICVGIEEGRPGTGFVGMTGSLVLRHSSGATFNCGSGLSIKKRKEYWANPDLIVGKLVTVKFQEKYASGIPRFPIYKTVRDYE